MAPQHPEWKETEPFKSVLAGDREAMSKFSEKDWMEIVAVTHAGMSTEEFLALVKPWITTAKAPRFDRLFTDLVYQPMLEVMKYLREKDFRVYIVTGGGQEFVRVYSDQVYGVPPEQVVGSSIVTKYDISSGKPVLHARTESRSSLTMAREKRSASICSSASGRTRPSAIPTAMQPDAGMDASGRWRAADDARASRRR